MPRKIEKITLLYRKARQRLSPMGEFWHRYKLFLLGLLGALVLISLVAARFLPAKTTEPVVEVSAPRQVKATYYGSVVLSEKATGVVKNLTSIVLVAQTNGPVSQVKVAEGQTVGKNGFILNQTSAYGAGSAASVQRQIAGKNFELAKATLSNTTEVVAKNRTLADQNRENTEELRKITEVSISEIKSLLTTTEQVITQIESDIATEQAGANNPATIQALRQLLISYKGVLNTNRSALRSAEYTVNTSNPPTDLANLTRDLVYTTTELQLKSAQINKDVAFLNLQLAKINEASTRVVAPFAGTIEKIFVQPGQYLTPGTPVAKIKGETKLCLQIAVAGEVAARINDQEWLEFTVNERHYSVPITHVSSTPINGQLFEVLAILPAEYQTFMPEESTVTVKLPLYQVSMIEGNYFLPLDAVFITNNTTYVLVDDNGRAIKKEIVTGEIVGSTIEIKAGLLPGQVIILDRRVIEGEVVKSEIYTESMSFTQELG